MPTVTESCALLSEGRVEVLGLLPYSSNYVFLTKVLHDGVEALAVYKPTRGERPLWDFPSGTLAHREVAAFLVSEAAGFNFVPPTVLRRRGPMGQGSLQLFVEHDPERHFFVLMQERPERFQEFAAFDAVINNADRKGGHVLEDARGRLWAVDHGLSFHVHSKLRTVIWAFADEPIAPEVRMKLESLGAALSEPDGLGGELSRLLSRPESAATLGRLESLLVENRFPQPAEDRPLPWPLV
jgi:uncharacterized repeat protein (TIGR03843 family)